MEERFGIIQFGGQDQTVLGSDVVVGQKAPEFAGTAQDWTEVQALASTAGKVRVLAAVPSLDTPVCDRETRRFNQEAARWGRMSASLSSAPTSPLPRNAGVARRAWTAS